MPSMKLTELSYLPFFLKKNYFLIINKYYKKGIFNFFHADKLFTKIFLYLLKLLFWQFKSTSILKSNFKLNFSLQVYFQK